MIDVLWISLIGMSLVFVAILLLWGLMALLVRLTTRSGQAETPALEAASAIEVEAGSSAIPQGSLEFDSKRRAAAAAVAIALAMQKTNGASRLVDRPSSVSAWQAVHRASQLSRQSNGIKKKVIR
jgi:Na+-transporting methylmalonyl-CoA/oxaloacetate decarboxylase gamma subunit